MWRVVVPKKAQKDLERVAKSYQGRLLAALELLREEPYAGKKMGGHPARYALRVWPYRIIYEVDKRQRVIAVLRIGHRQGVYRK
ncbi:MAG: type II toxin-antitoxin system RelE/ParE family toxin [Candidatus Andersenbacteria bacterium CG10_big_fil_rev_8_21_14_0_10_54_11]|uniref:Type II toxin-antitoxin system RelE/ParE family toxin n=1 Tax=Candidatus Andersenbacteria bacterium CG10_big_fil_rev_8_21_14_0_10_54_11 TaxID=1974485 RepID=A0A2M6WZR3_9BACT|nr:MAG: type II toxin-antitoxin system RelE/ParE family toxin [Candidatus Andersenbacteria bacterium CG10_big_fil_rev_8_21_14_0_10_54_11]